MKKRLFLVHCYATCTIGAESEDKAREMINSMSKTIGPNKEIHLDASKQHEFGWIFSLTTISADAKMQDIGEE